MDRENEVFEVTGWKGTGGKTLGFRFGAANARSFVDRSRPSVTVELDGAAFQFSVRDSFWRHCPEIRGAPITDWFNRHRLAPWSSGSPPRVSLIRVGVNHFRVVATDFARPRSDPGDEKRNLKPLS
jgi:hypothetical protein